MKILLPNRKGVNNALSVLRAGGVVAHATETCYGLACDLRNPGAVTKLFKIKQRPPDQPVSALFSSIKEAKKYAEWNVEADKLAEKYLPGPLTIVLPMRKTSALLPSPSRPPSPTLGIRLSSHPLAQQLVMEFASPLSTTSANLHGRPNTYSPSDILEQFGHQACKPDLILDSGAIQINPPSTVVDLTQPIGGFFRRGAVNPQERLI
ncbi:threonylcarbamoyl-AMP synthase [Candidatus Peregrinibacteria bacterium]|nr:threonylcarbamoyl-AMP synthase [Candidatus Peregrinibacteria bacterium]